MDNLTIYDRVREVPAEAKKSIPAGRLKGMTDINPMWRIKKLTEIFGACGVGWKYEITSRQIVDGANGEKVAFTDINLYYIHEGIWSEPIPGTGGSSFIAKEKSGLYTSDECFKMALTDAISVAAKALGVGADVYFASDRSKYSDNSNAAPATSDNAQAVYNDKKKAVESMIDEFVLMTNRSDEDIINAVLENLKIDVPYESLTLEQLNLFGGKLLGWINKKRKENNGG